MRLFTGVAVLLLNVLPDAIPVRAADYFINVNDTAQPVLGFGAQVWSGNTIGQSVLADLEMDFARMQSGVNWFNFSTQPPTDSNVAAGDNYTSMYNYIAANFNGPNGSEPWHLPSIKSSYIHAQANGVDIILNEFKIANSFLNSQNTKMLDNLVDDYATFLAAQIDYLADQNVYPAYIEMANEPNGEWNGYISPTQYNNLVQQTRAQLDAHGFSNVGIIGPGLSEIGGTRTWNWHEVTDWVDTLDANAVNSLAGWSAHTWDDWAGLEGQVQVFNNAINTAEPSGDKPVFITEYATSISSYGGIDYGSPDSGGGAADQSAFAVRVFDNTITLLNNGASALILWEAADKTWSDSTWGLRRLDGTERPTYLALEALLTELPDDAHAIEGLGSSNGINAAAVASEDKLIVAMANTTDQAQQRELQFEGMSLLTLDRAVRFINGDASEYALALNGNTISVVLAPQSTLTLILNYDSLAGDINGDGFVGLDDLDVLLNHWNQAVPVGDISQGDIAGIGDGYVGLSDLDVILNNWNASLPPVAGIVIPEPAAIWTLSLFSCGLFNRR